MIDQGETPTETNLNGPGTGDLQPNCDRPSHNKQQFACLYTKHKTQKHKKWNDGRMIVNRFGCRLYDADPQPGAGDPMIDTCALSGNEAQSILSGQRTDVETEKFLITIDGPWKTPPTIAPPSKVTASQGMSKLLQSKYRKPKRMGPPPPSKRPDNPVFSKRQRPLQPGELQRRYYGQQVAEPPPIPRRPPPRCQELQTAKRTNHFIAPPQGFEASNFYEEDETISSSVAQVHRARVADNDKQTWLPPPAEPNPQSQVQASWFQSPQSSQATLDDAQQNHQQSPIHERQNSHPQAFPDHYNAREDSSYNGPQAFTLQPPSPSTFAHPVEELPKQSAFPSSGCRTSQYYGDESEEDPEKEEERTDLPQVFAVPTSYRSVRRDKASRAELLDIFSDKPSTTDVTADEFVLPDGSSSDEES